MLKRTHYCEEIGEPLVGHEVSLCGWAQTIRDHGGVIFLDLRDRSGVVQIVCNPGVSEDAHRTGETLRTEYVIAVRGAVQTRSETTVNLALPTGTVEILATQLEILNRADTPPFSLEEDDINEAVRLKYRYLDIRRPSMMRNLLFRHQVNQTIRGFLDERGFVEVETPILTRSTPEGARDFLVPSRLNPGSFYALPQSPQLFKQLLMAAGLDRYYQIVRCFRDEDLRADRQPEFTQLDLELSFIDESDVMDVVETLLVRLFRETLDREIKVPFPRISYDEAMLRYGTDCPDTRFGLELTDVSHLFRETGVRVFQKAIAEGGVVKAINVKKGHVLSRKELDELTSLAGRFGAKGMAWIKVEGSEWLSPIVKFFNDAEKSGLRETMGMDDGDLVLFGADHTKVVNDSLSQVRLAVGERMGLIDSGRLNFIWVTEFPLLKYDMNDQRYVAVHHPFTAPIEGDLGLIEENPKRVRSRAYDIVLNGIEIGGGSIRIHDCELQERMFEVLSISREEAHEKFSFLLEAFRYGAPPHGGIALGLDRLIMLMLGGKTIREVIAFPKTQKGACMVTSAPAEVDVMQLTELGLRLDVDQKKN